MHTRIPVLAVAFAALTACPEPGLDTGDDDGDPVILDTQVPEWTDTSTSVRFMHMSPDLALGCGEVDTATGEDEFKACVDLYVGGAPLPLTTAFPFGASTGFVPGFPSGDQSLVMNHLGTTDLAWQADAAALVPESLTTVIVKGGATSPGGSTVQTLVLEDDPTPPAAGMVRLRIHHIMTGGLEAAPAFLIDHITDEPIDGAAGMLTFDAPLEVEVPQATYDADGDGIPDSNLWRVDLTLAGLNSVPVLWHMDIDGNGAADDGDIFDVFVLFQPLPPPSAPGIPVFLIHTATSQEPGQFTPPPP